MRIDERKTKPWLRLGVAAAIACALLPQPVLAQARPDVVAALRKADGGDGEIRGFYAARGFQPLWIRGGTIGPEAERALDLLVTADRDGLNPDSYRPREVAKALDRAVESRSPKALAKAEMLLSRSFAAYLRDVRAPRQTGMVYVDKALAPTALTARGALEAAARTPSLQTWLDELGWMHPIYAQLREALAEQEGSREGRRAGASPDWDGEEARLIRINMARARALPADPGDRYVLVDAAAARLWMYQDGRPVDSMKVIVGKDTEQTPMMAGLIRFAMTNPYWNIPPDLVRLRVAPGAIKSGAKFLKTKRYEVTTDWSDDAKPMSAAKVDWKAVAAGTKEVPVRQLPGKDNAMGRMKFMFPNDLGIYLHDTPDKKLFAAADRRFSSGCVRVEDAPRLAKWLFGKPLAVKPGGPEKRVDLPTPVPVFITYLTAAPEGETIAFRNDGYGRDGAGRAGRALARR
ncbi:MAG TPA: L,D-transpeptidase family protein [Allosphingosinicella sp.]|jgi:murein L,D-transpeptidase YcbB/YkuD